MKKLYILFVLVLSALPCSMWAQKLRGTVIDANKEAVIGATIKVKSEPGKGTITDIKGGFVLQVKEGTEIEITYLGMKKKQVAAHDGMTVIMEESATMLNEVVAVGYGQMKRPDITGAVVSVDKQALETHKGATLDQALQGRAAGVQMTSNTGIPGGSTSIQIRGVNSLNASNEPIYVVDGVIISGQTGDNTKNATANINPADIDHIEILKDASATAIYGAQAANGVILITMKKGKPGAPQVNFNAYYGWQNVNRRVDLMDLPTYAEWFNDYTMVHNTAYLRQYYAYVNRLGSGTDWQDAIFRTAAIQSYNLSVRSADDKGDHSISGGFFSQDGVAVNSGFKRGTMRVEENFNINEQWRVGGSIDGQYSYQNIGMAQWAVMGSVLNSEPSILLKDMSGAWSGETEEDPDAFDYVNPVAISSITKRNTKHFGVRGNMYAEYKPVRWLRFRTEFAGNSELDRYQEYIPAYKFGTAEKTYAENRQERNWIYFWAWKNEMDFDYTFGSKHHVTFMLGTEINTFDIDNLMAKRTHGDNELEDLSAGNALYSSNSGSGTQTRNASVFGRLFYNYDNRYMITTTLRHDGSSNFARGNRWGTFPSVALGWRISEEPFFTPLKNVVNNLKIRLGWGKVGNSNTQAFAYKKMLNYSESAFGVAYDQSNQANENLKWETTNSYNAGFDLNLLDNRIELIFDIYLKRTKNLLLQTVLPNYTGTTGVGSTTSKWENIGSMQNKGFEFTLNTHNIKTKDFQWTTGITYSLNRNKIRSINTETGYINKTLQEWGGQEFTVTRSAVGHSVSEFYGYEWIGRINSASDFLKDNGDGTSTVTVATPNYRKGSVVSNTASLKTSVGDFLFADMNNDGIIDENDQTFLGSPLPKFTFGVNNTFRYKDFDLSVFFYGSVGGKILNFVNRKLLDANIMGNHLTKTSNYPRIGYKDGNSSNTNVWNLYVQDGSRQDVSRIVYSDANQNSRISSRLVESGSFLRPQNILFGWIVPKKWLDKAKISNARLYVNMQNLFTISGYSGFDPEVGATQAAYTFSGQDMLLYGVDTGRCPSPTTITLGLDVT